MTGVWISRTSRGETAYQRPDGSYFLQYADGTTKPLSELRSGALSHRWLISEQSSIN